MQVKVVMRSPLTAVDVDAPLDEARALMGRYGVRHVPVKERDALVGLVSERDLRRAEPSTLSPLETWEWKSSGDRPLRVRDVETAPLVSVAPDTDVKEAAALLAVNRLEALPVVEEGEVVGLVGVRDLLGVLARDVERPRHPRLGHILAVVDDDRTSRTLPTAIAAARQHDARLTLVWVLPPLPRPQISEISPERWHEINRQRKQNARAWLSAQVAGALEGRAVDVVIAEGRLAVEVAALAERREADLIVADARVATSLVPGSPCAVLGVPAAGRNRRARG